jgi:formate/nitrite transporter FocA (FNT family)
MEATQDTKKTKIKKAEQQPLAKRNFIMMAIAGAMIVVGFLLMLGSSSTTEAYNSDIFSTRRIVVGPLFAFLGFVFMAVAIIIRPDKSKK